MSFLAENSNSWKLYRFKKCLKIIFGAKIKKKSKLQLKKKGVFNYFWDKNSNKILKYLLGIWSILICPQYFLCYLPCFSQNSSLHSRSHFHCPFLFLWPKWNLKSRFLKKMAIFCRCHCCRPSLHPPAALLSHALMCSCMPKRQPQWIVEAHKREVGGHDSTLMSLSFHWC